MNIAMNPTTPLVSRFDALEADFFGDLAEDTHGVWEVFEFVRLHYPELTDEQVFERGYDYIAQWLRSGWIRVSDAPLHPTTVRTHAELLHFLQERGPAASRYCENAPSVDLTDEAKRVYESETI
ncbi:MAG: hypothetical protein ACXWIU_10505 [Limisphaerales bacterium]